MSGIADEANLWFQMEREEEMKPKDQGTREETRIVQLHRTKGISSRRLAEGGAHDEGDIEVWWRVPSDNYEYRIVGEVKDRERLNAPEALEKAIRKSGTHRTPLFWSQPVKGGLVRRRRRVVVISQDFWFELIGGTDG
jgi:hypothetical protein